MKHRDAQEHLVDFAEGALNGPLLRDLTSHVRGCPDCQEWLEAFDIMANSARLGAESEHPSSHLIALCAVRAEEEFELDRSDLRQHLERCGTCRSELEMLKGALDQARPVVEPLEARRFAGTIGQWWKAAAAAALVGIAVTALLGPSFRDSERPDDISSIDGSAHTQAGLPNTDFSEAVIDGERLIKTDGTLTISETKINAGAVVRIQAVRTVAIGNGFEVGPQTRLEVGVSPG